MFCVPDFSVWNYYPDFSWSLFIKAVHLLPKIVFIVKQLKNRINYGKEINFFYWSLPILFAIFWFLMTLIFAPYKH